MQFPTKYNCLIQNEFKALDHKIIPIRYEDRLDIMKWRNEQMYHLRQAKPLTEIDQEKYFRKTVSDLFDQEKPKQILFSFLKNGKCIGYGGLVHINWIDKNAEISFITNTELEKDYFSKYWTIFLNLIEQVAFKELNLFKIFTYAYDLRPLLYVILEDSGYIKEKEIIDQPVKIVIHSKFNQI